FVGWVLLGCDVCDGAALFTADGTVTGAASVGDGAGALGPIPPEAMPALLGLAVPGEPPWPPLLGSLAIGFVVSGLLVVGELRGVVVVACAAALGELSGGPEAVDALASVSVACSGLVAPSHATGTTSKVASNSGRDSMTVSILPLASACV
ncbi:MAG TPA: hypothetical protein VHM70_06650, partial [Polyangiaceae bacterium]|nr:hypothetical protein [Polyangiaceae bacterium]